ncbi:poly [ADP-ribose] polymerase tankyrase-1-like [Impatiens glandulifera]|uniref:poly [ADP-ribose] polymerase tankyrase-1-like n=1 Tax=Impatiens glandulifera TaxID=253017 RepID=UPI001FB0B3C4|nr:poly [ADP-ribose] polymerase tankyrase-1-like [Impatiens glandulifera]
MVVPNFIDSSSSDDNYNSSDGYFSSSSSDSSSDDENFAAESNILPRFKDIAEFIQNEDVNQLHIAIDNLTGSIDEPSIDGDTVLHHACNCFSRKSFEPLHEAVSGRNINIVKLILDIETRNSGSINKMLEAVDIFGDTPLHTAALHGNYKIAKLLLRMGASTQKSNHHGKYPYELAKPNSELRRILKGIH